MILTDPNRADGHTDEQDSESTESINPFVPMPMAAIWTIRIFAICYTALVCSVALFNSWAGGISMVGIAVSNAWLIFWVFYPFIFYKPTYGWCHPLVLSALLGIVSLVLRKTTLFMTGLSEHIMLVDWSTSELNWIYVYGNFVNSLALIALYVGFSIGPRLRVPGLQAVSAPSPRLYLVLLIFLGISVTAFVLYAQLYGGFYSFVKGLAFGMTKQLDLTEDIDGLGQYTILIKMATIVAVIWVCSVKNAFRDPLFCFVAFAALILAYLSDGKRSNIIYPAVLIALSWVLRNRKVPIIRLGAVGVAAFLLLGFLGLFRSSNWSEKKQLDFDFIQEVSLANLAAKSQEELIKRSSSESTYFAILAKVPHQEKLLYGKTYLEWGLRFIPRELWPDKPRGVDVQANQTFYGADWGLPAGAVGEAYWNFHLPGVLLVFFIFGVCKRWLRDLLIHYPEAPGVMVIYMITLFYLDPSQNGFRTWLYAIAPCLIMLRFGGLLGRSRAGQHTVPNGLPSQSHAG